MPAPIDYNELASEYDRHRKLQPNALRQLIRRGELTGHSKVLETGCGTGNYSVGIQSNMGCRCWGLDPSREMLRKARSKSSEVEWRIGRAERLTFPARSFDLVFSVDAIHHFSDRARCFEEAHRVLKHGGKVCTVTNTEWQMRHRKPLSEYFPAADSKDLARIPKIQELKRTMVAAGFANIGSNVTHFRYKLHDSQPYKDKFVSTLRMIPEAAFRKGMSRMERDLKKGPIDCDWVYLMLWGTK